ncbi:MAG TPA: hypothetical protein VJ806_05660 [Luteimonas sp.]|nr:hypothetical protein [Luteimonas sp.]
MKISPYLAALAIVLASALIPASAQPNAPAVLGKPTTYTAKRNLYHECLGMMLADSLMHGFMNKGGLFAELNGIMSACKINSHM